MRIPIILALGILAAASRIKVLSPDEVANWFQTQNCTFLSSLDTIQGSDANFGHIPYGKTIVSSFDLVVRTRNLREGLRWIRRYRCLLSRDNCLI